MISLTSDVMIPAESGADDDADRQVDRVPFDREFFEFLEHGQGCLRRHDVDKLFGNDHDLANRLAVQRILHFRVGARGGLEVGVGRVERYRDPVAHFSVHLQDDLDFIFDEEGLVVARPALGGDRAAKLRVVPKART